MWFDSTMPDEEGFVNVAEINLIRMEKAEALAYIERECDVRDFSPELRKMLIESTTKCFEREIVEESPALAGCWCD